MERIFAFISFFDQNQVSKVSKGAKIRNRYNQVPHLTQDTNGKMKNSQLDTTNKSQEISPFPAGDHKAHINRRSQRHSKHKTERKHKAENPHMGRPVLLRLIWGYSVCNFPIKRTQCLSLFHINRTGRTFLQVRCG